MQNKITQNTVSARPEKVSKHGIYNFDECRRVAQDSAKEMRTKCATVDEAVGNLSGGNNELFLKRTFVDVNEVEPAVSRSRSSYSRRSSVSSSRSSRSGRNSKKGKKKTRNTRSKSVTIRNGDTLSEIAARNGTTVKKLRKLNKISGNNIRAGKKLKVK